MTRIISILTIVALALVGVLTTACGLEQARSSTPPAAHLASPVRVAVIWDRPASATLQLRAEELDTLIGLLRRTGGELAIGVLKDGSDDPLVRMRVEAPPQAPEETGDVFYDAEQQSRFKAAHKSWREETDRRVVAFYQELQPLLTGRTVGDPDPWPLIRRAGVFLNEGDASWGRSTKEWLLVVSERERTARMCRDIYGARTVPPGSSFTGTEGGITYVCNSDGEWYRADILGQEAAGGVPLATPDRIQSEATFIGPLAAAARLVTVRTTTTVGLLDDFGPNKFGNVESAFRFIVAAEGGAP